MHDLVDEIAVLSRWLGRDVEDGRGEVVPVWNAFRFCDAAVLTEDAPESAGRTYLVRGASVSEFVRSRTSIDEAYARVSHGLLGGTGADMRSAVVRSVDDLADGRWPAVLTAARHERSAALGRA